MSQILKGAQKAAAIAAGKPTHRCDQCGDDILICSESANYMSQGARFRGRDLCRDCLMIQPNEPEGGYDIDRAFTIGASHAGCTIKRDRPVPWIGATKLARALDAAIAKHGVQPFTPLNFGSGVGAGKVKKCRE